MKRRAASTCLLSLGAMLGLPRAAHAAIGGLPPNLLRSPPGCPFNPRCHMARDVCRTDLPPLHEVTPGRFSACHYAEEVINA